MDSPGQPNMDNPTDSSQQPPVLQAVRPKKDRLELLNRPWYFLGGLILIVLAVGAWLWYRHSSPSKNTNKPLTPISVRLEWVNNPEFAGMYIAQDKGFYRARGLSVTLKEFEEGDDVNREVANGTVDYGVSTPLELILARDSGYDNEAVAAIYQTSPFAFAAQKSANIHSPADFRGKILGDTGDNNEAKVTYAVLMAKAGLKPTDATIKAVDFDPLKVLTQNQAQTADLYRNDQTYLLDKAGVAYNLLLPEQFGFKVYGDILVANDTKIKQKADETRNFVQATLQGWQYAIDHPDESIGIISRHMNALYQDPAYMKYDFSSTLPLIKAVGGNSLGAMDYTIWNRAYISTDSTGLLKNTTDIQKLYTNQFIR